MLPLAASLACLAVRCTEVAVFKDEDGKTRVAAAGPDVPPVEFGEEGPPTPTPGPYEPVYPITPPAPTPTPRPK
jgi:hypothetical protein